MKNFPFDGTGFVTGRGASKYYGVSRDLTNKKSWRIQINDVGGNHTFTFDCAVIKEETAAKIAACLAGGVPRSKTAILADGKYWIVDPTKSFITYTSDRSSAWNQVAGNLIDFNLMFDPEPQNSLQFDAFEPTPVIKPKQTKYTDDEKALIKNLFNLVHDDGLSEEAANVILDIIEIHLGLQV